MVYAFVLVKTGPAASPEVLSAVESTEAVRAAHIVAGEFDVIVEVEAPEVQRILDLVSETIQSLEGVVETKTYISLGD